MNTDAASHNKNTLEYSSLMEKIESEIDHIDILVNTRLDSLKTLMDQRVEFLTLNSKKDLEAMSEKLKDVLQELRSYKEILQQQLVLLDQAIKSAHQRLDSLQIQIDETVANTEVNRRLLSSAEAAVKDIQTQLGTVQTKLANEDLLDKAKKESPIRVFFTEQILKKYTALLIGSVISYILLNLKTIFIFLSDIFKE